MILGEVATSLGSASQDGEITVSITEDPVITLANVSLPIPQTKESSPEADRKARQAAIDAARREILKLIQLEKPISINLLNTAEIAGATTKNISLINTDIAQLSKEAKESIASVQKIVFKFLTVDRVGKGERVYISDLQSSGILKAETPNKSSILIALRKAVSSQVDTFEGIQTFVATVEKKFADRKSRMDAVLARIKSFRDRLTSG